MLEQTRPTYPLDPATGLHAKRAVDSVAALGELPDLLLVERSRARDSRALETLIRRYSRRLFRIARSILANDDEAEDAVRAALVRAFSNLDRYEPAGKFGSWLARLAFNEALTLRRAASARSQSGAAPASELRVSTATAPTLRAVATSSAAVPATSVQRAVDLTVTATTDLAVTHRLLEEAIDSLPEVFRTVLVLRIVEELSGVEVAVCLGLNETTVRTRLFRAQQRLKVDVARRLRAEPRNVFELTAERSERLVSQVLGRLPNGASTAEAR